MGTLFKGKGLDLGAGCHSPLLNLLSTPSIQGSGGGLDSHMKAGVRGR